MNPTIFELDWMEKYLVQVWVPSETTYVRIVLPSLVVSLMKSGKRSMSHNARVTNADECRRECAPPTCVTSPTKPKENFEHFSLNIIETGVW